MTKSKSYRRKTPETISTTVEKPQCLFLSNDETYGHCGSRIGLSLQASSCELGAPSVVDNCTKQSASEQMNGTRVYIRNYDKRQTLDCHDEPSCCFHNRIGTSTPFASIRREFVLFLGIQKPQDFQISRQTDHDHASHGISFIDTERMARSSQL